MNIRYSDCHDEQYNDDSGSDDNDKNNVEDGDKKKLICFFFFQIIIFTCYFVFAIQYQTKSLLVSIWSLALGFQFENHSFVGKFFIGPSSAVLLTGILYALYVLWTEIKSGQLC